MMFSDSHKCPVGQSAGFGPASDCPGVFDFSLFFEESILTIIPASLSIPLAAFYCYILFNARIKVSWAWQLYAKVALWSVLVLTNMVHLGVTARPSSPITSASIAACVLVIFEHVAFGILSHLTHLRSVTPSTPIVLLTALTLVFDVARCRTLWLVEGAEQLAGAMTASVVVKAMLLVLESLEKRSILLPEYRDLAPESTAGILSQLFAWWLNPLLLHGFSKVHTLDTLMDIDPSLFADEDGAGSMYQAWAAWRWKETSNTLLLVTLKHHKAELGMAVLPRLLQTGFTFAQPFLVERITQFIQLPHDPNNNSSVGAGLVFGYMVVYAGIAVTTSLQQHWTVKFMARVRAQLLDMIYRRTLEIRCTDVDAADAVTLMSTDVERVVVGFKNIHDLWASLLEISLGFWLLSGSLELASLAPGIVIIVCTGAAIKVAAGAPGLQKAWIDRIQERIATTTGALANMIPVRMTGMGKSQKEKITKLREVEVQCSSGFRAMLVKIVVLTFSTGALTPVASFGFYILLQQYQGFPTFNVTQALTSLTLIQLTLGPLSILLDTLEKIMSTVGCLDRIRGYLVTNARVDGRLHGGLSDLRKTWVNYSKKPRPESLFPNDKEKGALPDAIYNNSIYSMYYRESTASALPAPLNVALRGDVTSSTAAHVQNASAIWKDSANPVLKDVSCKIPHGKLTMIIGHVGSGKSTLLHTLLGETQSLDGSIQVDFDDVAYCSQRPWLCNTTIQKNILGKFGLDAAWYAAVVNLCGLAQDLKNFPDGDQTLVGGSGSTLSGGQQMRLTLARALYSGKRTMLLDDVMAGLDPKTEEAVFASLLSSKQGILRQNEVTVVFATNSVGHLAEADHIIVLGKEGTVIQQGSYNDLYLVPGYVADLNVANRDGSITTEDATPEVDFDGSDALGQTIPGMEQANDSAGDLTIYKYYIESFGWKKFAVFMALCSVHGFGVVFPELWVQWWATYNQEHPGEKAGYYFGILAMIAVITISSLGCACAYFVFAIVPYVAREMHARILKAVFNSPSSFFSETDIGSLTNRFSQDMELIDMELPVSFIYTILTALILVAQTCVIAATGRYVAAALPFCVLATWFIQKYYLKTSRTLRLLDIEAKSALFSHFIETLNGLVTIRAFNWTEEYTSSFLQLANRSQRPQYLLFSVQRWLGLVLDLLICGVAVILAIVAVTSQGKIDAGLMGIALINIVGFSATMKQMLTNWTQLETSAGAVSRIRSFTAEAISEHDNDGDEQPPSAWPAHGHVRFENVVASYGEACDPVLKGVTLDIEAGQKIGICGRSGSGKSSLVSTLLRMLEQSSGSVTIDGLELSRMPREIVRERLNALPQHPFLLPGSVRHNVDPLDESDAEAIMEALDDVGLWELFKDLEEGIEAPLPADMLSLGQKQLLCLARAMVRKSKILILDEATASVDVNTEAMMQRLIQKNFEGKTILAVAHKLDTILDFDKVAIMDAGRIVEYGEPRQLLTRPSEFRQLYNAMKGFSEEDEEQDDVVGGELGDHKKRKSKYRSARVSRHRHSSRHFSLGPEFPDREMSSFLRPLSMKLWL